MQGASLAVARFVAGMTWEQVPEPVRHQARRAVVDTIGCLLGGHNTPLTEAVQRALADQGAIGGPCHVPGTSLLATPPVAALLGAFAANALDFDDTFEAGGANPISHPGSTTVPAALAVAEHLEASGAEFLTAVAVGYEIAIRVGLAVQPTQERRNQVWGLGVHQVFGAASAAARLLHLDENRVPQALGCAGVHTSLPSAWTAAGWVKDAVAWPAMTGVLSAYLVRAGYVGPSRIFDGRRSYYASAGSDTYRPERLAGDLGAVWYFLDLSFKPYPACRWLHPALDALDRLMAEHRFDAGQVEAVRIAGMWELERMFARYAPKDLVDAQFSLPFVCALVLLRRPVGPGWFSDETLSDPEVLELARKVTITTDPEVEADRRAAPDRLRTTVEVRLRSGRCLTAIATEARGNPRHPLSDGELESKFRLLATPVLGTERAEQALRLLWSLDEVPNIKRLCDLLTPV